MKALFLTTFCFLIIQLQAQDFYVTEVSPSPNIINAEADDPIMITFSESLNPFTVFPENILVMGRWSGPAAGELVWTEGTNVVAFVPDEPFFAGEMVMVNVTKWLGDDNGNSLETAYQFSYWIKTEPSTMIVNEVLQIEMKEDGETWIQCYGAYAGDLNDDGSSDLFVVNENSEDARVMLNDGDGNYGDWQLFDLSGSSKPSTNEGSDFNHDGLIDIAIGSTQGPEVSVLRGVGGGSFAPEMVLESSEGVRGLSIIDFNGDGWDDIATASRIGNEVGFFENNQDGTFADPYFMEANGDKETACVAADMNEDGILDLVVGAYTSSELIVLQNDGDGNFTIVEEVSVFANPWMIGYGDVNGDGHLDIVSANAGGPNCSVSFGNGDGTLQDAVYYTTGGFPLAIDLGDLDGDGDLDMISSDYFGVSFTLFENAGDGTFINPTSLPAVGAGSCAIFHDRDGDGEMDLTAVDEIDDIVIIYEKGEVVSTNESVESNFGHVYPNPARTEFYLPTGFPMPCEISIYDFNGKLMDQRLITSNQKIEINEEWESGLYNVHLHSAGVTHSIKLIKE